MDVDSIIKELKEGTPEYLAAAGAVAIVVGATAISCCLRSSSSSGDDEKVPSQAVTPRGGGVSSEDGAGGGATTGTKKKKKKKSKKKAAGGEGQTEAAVTTPAPAPAPEPTPTETTAAAAATDGGKKKKKKKKSKNKTGGGTTEPQKTTTTPPAETTNKVGFDSDDDDEPLQPAVAPVKKPQAAEPTLFGSGGKLTKQQLADIDDGWVVEGAKAKSKKKAAAAKKRAAAAAQETAATTTAASTTESKEYVAIDAKKIGILIGPKGATLHALQDATNTKIETPQNRDRDDKSPVKVIVTGSSPADVKKAKSAIKELCDKGYTSVIEGEGFLENYVSMHPMFLSEIVGPGGSVIKAIQQKLNVKVSIPSTDWKPGNTYTHPIKNVRVGVAGKKEDCVMAKAVITSIVRYHHHEITHPGLIHREVDVPDHFLNYVIGIKGSEIRHIKGNYKCDVHIPNAESYCEHVLVVGRPEDADRAVKHIHNLMERISQQNETRYDDEEW